MALRVGTSGWAYSAWKPGFYPPGVPSRKFLEFYSSRLNAVEANYTFRRYLSEETIAGWLEQTPANFQFAVKAHQSLTHLRRLKNVDEPLRLFLDSLLPLKKARRHSARRVRRAVALMGQRVALRRAHAPAQRPSSCSVAHARRPNPSLRQKLRARMTRRAARQRWARSPQGSRPARRLAPGSASEDGSPSAERRTPQRA